LRIPDVLATGLYRVRLHVPAIDNRPAINRCVPLVVRSSSLNLDAPPAKTALMVWPYLTWRAYNQFDADSNGIADTWYSRWKNRTVSLVGPYERLAQKDGCDVVQPFTGWAQATPGRNIQSITDVELGRMSQAAINRYASIWYPDHSEYFEHASYHKLMTYRANRGNLVFLSANNFFRTVHINGRRNVLQLAGLQERKDISTDYRLVGVGFDACCFPRSMFGMYTIGIGTLKAPWVLDGTGLGVGDEFGMNGLEVDSARAALRRTTRDNRGAINNAFARWARCCGNHGDHRLARRRHDVRDGQYGLHAHAPNAVARRQCLAHTRQRLGPYHRSGQVSTRARRWRS